MQIGRAAISVLLALMAPAALDAAEIDSPPPTSNQLSAGVRTAIADAQKLQQAGDHVGELAAYDAAHSKAKNAADRFFLHYLSAQAALKAGNWRQFNDNTVAYLDRGGYSHDTRRKAALNAAKAAGRRGDTDSVLFWGTQALWLKPGDTEYHIEFASLLAGYRHYTQAELLIDIGIDGTPDSFDLHAARSDIFAAQKNYGAAVAAAEKALAIKPHDFNTVISLANYARQSRDLAKARSALAKAIALQQKQAVRVPEDHYRASVLWAMEDKATSAETRALADAWLAAYPSGDAKKAVANLNMPAS